MDTEAEQIFQSLRTDDRLEHVWTDGWSDTLASINTPERAQSFIEICEEIGVNVTSDPPGRDWRELPPNEIIGLARTLAISIRKHLVLQ